MGVGTSPLLYKDLVILPCDEDNGDKSYMAGLDKKTGKEVWRTPRKIQVSWATPVIVKAEGRDELVTSGTEAIIAYDPATGKELWRMKGLESNAVPSPVAGDGVVVLSAGDPTSWRWRCARGVRGRDRSPGALEVHEGDGLRPFADPLRRPCLPDDGQGAHDLPRRKTGEVKYEGGRPPCRRRFMASPIAIDGKLLIMSQDGDTS